MNKEEAAEHTQKIRAGMLLSKYLKIIAREKTELVKDPKTGEDRIASKAEALSRKIWKMALGYEEENVKTNTTKVYAPDKAMMRLVFDRIEGKTGSADDPNKNRDKIADQVTQMSKDRINSMTGDVESG